MANFLEFGLDPDYKPLKNLGSRPDLHWVNGKKTGNFCCEKAAFFKFFGLHSDLDVIFENSFGLWLDFDGVLKNQDWIWIAKHESPLISGKEAVCSFCTCLCAGVTPMPNALESCANQSFWCKRSKDWASLLVCNEKIFFGLGFRIFCEWRHKWRVFRSLWPTSSRRWRQPLDGSISLKLAVGTRLKYESFEPLIDFLAFLVQKLR